MRASKNSPTNVTIKVKRLRPSATIPAYQSAHAAGMDLVADLSAPILIAPRERRPIPTGIALEIPPATKARCVLAAGAHCPTD